MAVAVKISDELIKEARKMAKLENRSVSGQVEYWAKIGKIASENTDLTFEEIREILISLAEAAEGEVSEYNFD